MSQDRASSLPTPGYFSDLAATYARQTGNVTHAILDGLVQNHLGDSIGSDSVLHDNAAGPGTATTVLLGRGAVPAEIAISDNNPGMIAAARAAVPSAEAAVTFHELDSQDLGALPGAHFTHSVTNFSIFAFDDPARAVREVHRTLRPGGLAVFTCYRRFGLAEVIRAAQRLVRPDLPPMPVPGPEFYEEGHMARVVAEGGFDEDKMRVVSEVVVVREGGDMDGLREFALGPFTERAREGWTGDEDGRWPDAVEQATRDEIQKYGGIKFEAWAVMATR